MKTLLLALALSLGTISAQAGNWIGQHYGNTDYWHNSDGSNYTGMRYGNTYYWSGWDQNGNWHSGVGQQYGNTTYWDDAQ
jgi:hypothetical protein